MMESVRVDGTERRKKGRTEAVLFRCTPERKAQLARLAARLSIGRPDDEKVSFTDTLNRALDALEDSLKGKRQ